MAAEDFFNKQDYRNDQNSQIDGDNIWNKDYRGDESGVGGGFFGNLWQGAKDLISSNNEKWSNKESGWNNKGGDGSGGGDDGGGYPGNPMGDGDGTPTGAFDSANFNVEDKEQVMGLQKQLFPDDPSQWDGMFGPKTQGAYRNMVNQQRTAGGQDAYTYGGPPVNDEQGGLLQTQGINNQFGNPMANQNVPSGVDTSQTPFERNQAARSGSGTNVGGGGFMDKFGTGEGWFSQGAERRAARRAARK
tara:strand:- start:454 stop:1191 length:738 start_codon:yes stop_codon:yes gene_type:complete